ncbi:MAG: hypothetical protein EXX96DRAFT_538616 [Benjaminiella poitrasii]|nr:MAG: hypothetical protein EXX96DRAFT_538616 [Benjaminiella poitrasii]
MKGGNRVHVIQKHTVIEMLLEQKSPMIQVYRFWIECLHRILVRRVYDIVDLEDNEQAKEGKIHRVFIAGMPQVCGSCPEGPQQTSYPLWSVGLRTRLFVVGSARMLALTGLFERNGRRSLPRAFKRTISLLVADITNISSFGECAAKSSMPFAVKIATSGGHSMPCRQKGFIGFTPADDMAQWLESNEVCAGICIEISVHQIHVVFSKSIRKDANAKNITKRLKISGKTFYDLSFFGSKGTRDSLTVITLKWSLIGFQGNTLTRDFGKRRPCS